MTKLRVAVDIGGTFTDICILDEDSGALRVAKTASTPEDPLIGAMRGLDEAEVSLRDVTLFSHGTTVATNALITRRLPPAAMICTEGYRDVIEIRRSNKEDLWDTYNDVAQPYIRRRDRLTVRERIDHGGRVATPLDESDAREKARILRKRGVQAVAVCFMNSFINPQHEARMKEIPAGGAAGRGDHHVFRDPARDLRARALLHHRGERDPEPRRGRVRQAHENDALQQGGYASDLLMLHSGGGGDDASDRWPVRRPPRRLRHRRGRHREPATSPCSAATRTPSASTWAGTSCDVSLVFGGESRVTKDWHIEFGYPIRFPSIEVLDHRRGRRLARLDRRRGLAAQRAAVGGRRSGPQPATGAATPTPTNTDANLALGRLGTSLAGGQIELDKAASEEAVRTAVAEPLGMDPVTAAKAIVSVANANMADAVRLISISRGYDPRDFALVAFGGAGALHGVALAKELSIPTVIVPPNPGVTSALGCLLVDVRHDLSQTYLALAAEADPADIEARFGEMRRRRTAGW